MNLARYTSLLTVFIAALAPITSLAAPAPQVGAAIYANGVLPDGRPVVGTRQRLPALEGAAAACVQCHRRSGLGSAEGPFSMPPITARYLGVAREESRLSEDTQVAAGYHVGRAAFTDATLARAIREGVVPGGGLLNELMPRYPLDDDAMAALLAHLQTLGANAVSGVDSDTLHFATILAPDTDPATERGMLEVLEQYFAAPDPLFGAPRKMLHPNRMVGYRASGPKWALHVWRLAGPAADWERQLREHFAAEPVFAVLSGLGAGDWAPVQRFCEHAALPCVLPNVDLPGVAQGDFYSIYFSRGVLLEAELAAHWLTAPPRGTAPARVVQVYRRDDIGASAARALHAQLSAGGIAVVERALAPAADGRDWREATAAAGPGDALVLWARAGDLAALSHQAPAAGSVLLSGLMAGLDAAALPGPWRARARMTYPFDLPTRRQARTAMPRAWLNRHGIRLVDERVQIDTYIACVAMSGIVGTLFDAYSRELLIERFEDMMATSTNSARYPSLGLAQGQRFASKGGYVVRFDGVEPVADSGWIVP